MPASFKLLIPNVVTQDTMTYRYEIQEIHASSQFPEARLHRYLSGWAPPRDGFSLNIITTTDPKGGQILIFVASLDRLAEKLDANITLTIVDDLNLWTGQLPDFQPSHICVQVLSYVPILTQQKAIVFASTLSKQHADLTIDPDMYPALNALPAVIKLLKGGSPLVHCQRPDRHTASKFRQLTSWLYSFMFRLISGCSVRDANSPMVAYNQGSLGKAATNHIGTIYPRIYLYCLHKTDCCTVALDSDGILHPSHYHLLVLVGIFSRQLGSALYIRWRLFVQRLLIG